MNIENLGRFAVYVTAAVGYAVAGYMAKVSKDPAITFDPVRFGTTVAIGVVAGLIMAARGDETSQEAYAAAAAIAIPIVDKAVNYLLDGRSGATRSTSRP